MRQDAGENIVDRDHLHAETFCECLRDCRTGPVAEVRYDLETARGDLFRIDQRAEQVKIGADKPLRAWPDFTDCVPWYRAVDSAVINAEQLLRLEIAEIGAAGRERRDCVPASLMMSRSDQNCAVELSPPDQMMKHRSGADSRIDDFRAAAEQAGNRRIAERFRGDSGIHAHGDASAVEIRADRRRISNDVMRCQSGSCDAAHTEISES